jgi:hypothetical protein
MAHLQSHPCRPAISDVGPHLPICALYEVGRLTGFFGRAAVVPRRPDGGGYHNVLPPYEPIFMLARMPAPEIPLRPRPGR